MHLAPSSGVSYIWKQHPTEPAPFYVVQHLQLTDDVKLEWLRHEVGDNAPLFEFALHFKLLFSDFIHSKTTQLMTCLKLYREYVPQGAEGSAWRKESDLPPDVRELFRKAFNEEVSLCREHGVEIARGHQYCRASCKLAGMQSVCRTCGEAIANMSLPSCANCKWGVPPPSASRKRRREIELQWLDNWLETAIPEHSSWILKEKIRMGAKPDHVPAWSFRKRA